jgi:hypothetical protein
MPSGLQLNDGGFATTTTTGGGGGGGGGGSGAVGVLLHPALRMITIKAAAIAERAAQVFTNFMRSKPAILSY